MTDSDGRPQATPTDHSRADRDTASAGTDLPAGYDLRETTPSVAAFRRLRQEAGMADRSQEAVTQGLDNTTYGVHIVEEATGMAVGMGRIVGDGGSVFHVSDMAVAAPHQGRGLGSVLMETLVSWLRENAPDGAVVNLLADVDGFYERWGFRHAAPASKAMVVRSEEL